MDAEKLVKYQGTIYLSEEDLQDALKEDGATQSLIKTAGIVYKEEEEEEEEKKKEKEKKKKKKTYLLILKVLRSLKHTLCKN